MLEKNTVLTHLLEGTSSKVGEDFFKALVKHLCMAIDVHGAWVTEFDEPNLMLRSKAFWIDHHYVEGYNYSISNTPCELVYRNRDFFYVPNQVIDLFPNDPDLKPYGAISYMGVPLFDENRQSVIGHLAVLHNKPLEISNEIIGIFNIFANRAGAELLRLKQEKITREHQAQLSKLIESTLDAIIILNPSLQLVGLNTAAQRLLNLDNSSYTGLSFGDWIHPDHREKVRRMISNLETLPEGQQHSWVPNGLIIRNAQRALIQTEASLCCYTITHQTYFALVMRNINDRIEAEEKISKLVSETQYLKQIIAEEKNSSAIIGTSKRVKEVIAQAEQVAPVDTTVLIFGETGTGKELFAQEIHQKSKRSGAEFIKVNCAAIPAALMESEFFGHEKGAFTGATSKRDGRFALADQGTIFLDEIGELSLDLQAKLLRILQEGEFEPVGSSKTRKVDVRVIAATNRDLSAMIKQGKFREDLYYRLCVFPITLPPLRERDHDSVLIAQYFADKFSKRFGKKLAPLSAYEAEIITSYSWPGNIRELQNVIERSVILSQGPTINLQLSPGHRANQSDSSAVLSKKIYTMQELEEMEKENLRKAMEFCNWKVSGHQSASELLGIKPTTLASRLKALNITKK